MNRAGKATFPNKQTQTDDLYYEKDAKVCFNFWNDVPTELLKSLDVEARINGTWVNVGSNDNNRKRLIKFDVDQARTSGIRINLKETYGAPNPKRFEVRYYES